MGVAWGWGTVDLRLLVGISQDQEGENRQHSGLAYQPSRPSKHFAVFLICSGRHTHPMLSSSVFHGSSQVSM